MPDSLLDTPLTRAFGLDAPIVQAPVGGVANPDLVAAASACGVLGVMPVWFFPVDVAAEAVRKVAARTARPFAVNLRADLGQQDHASAALDAGAAAVHLFWGDAAPYAGVIRRAKGRLIVTVSDADTTKAALDAGADVLIAQGHEAGGHVFGETPLAELLPRVVDLAGDIPVAAAGGIVDAQGVRAAMALGAAGAAMGTRFVASIEANAHDGYKQALIDADGADTVMSLCFDDGWPNAPHRTLRNSTFRMWDRAGRPSPGNRPGEGDATITLADGRTLSRYFMSAPTKPVTGDWEATALYAGAGVGGITEILSVKDIVQSIRDGLAA